MLAHLKYVGYLLYFSEPAAQSKSARTVEAEKERTRMGTRRAEEIIPRFPGFLLMTFDAVV